MRRLETLGELQELTGIRESSELDFKEAGYSGAQTDASVEAAKDIAALANTLGGHLIVGASTDEQRNTCTGLHGLTNDDAKAVVELVERATRDRCDPSPLISAHLVSLSPEKAVVVVAVQPTTHALVGVKVGGDPNDKKATIWKFSIRVGPHTNYIQPSQFGVYESMTARRIAALLSQIPENERASILILYNNCDSSRTLKECRLTEVDLQSNVVRFEVDHLQNSVLNALDERPDFSPLFVALDEIITVYKAQAWTVRIPGDLQLDS